MTMQGWGEVSEEASSKYKTYKNWKPDDQLDKLHLWLNIYTDTGKRKENGKDVHGTRVRCQKLIVLENDGQADIYDDVIIWNHRIAAMLNGASAPKVCGRLQMAEAHNPNAKPYIINTQLTEQEQQLVLWWLSNNSFAELPDGRMSWGEQAPADIPEPVIPATEPNPLAPPAVQLVGFPS